MVQLTITVCSVCKEVGVSTEEFVLEGMGRKKKVDLCEAHRQTILGLMNLDDAATVLKPRKKAVAKKTSPARQRRPRVTTIEEIEAGKAAGTL